VKPRDADKHLSPEGKQDLIQIRDTAMSRIDLPKNRKVVGEGFMPDGNRVIDLEPIGPAPDIAGLLYTVTADMQLAGGLEYGLVWIPDLVEGLGLEPDEVYLAAGTAKAKRAKAPKQVDDLIKIRDQVSDELDKLRSAISNVKPGRWTDFIRAFEIMCERNPGSDECDVDALAKRVEVSV
jgi:hypothetical protein